MQPIEFIEKLVGLGYNFSVSPKEGSVVIEATFHNSWFEDGDKIVPPEYLPNLPYEIEARRDEDEDDFGIAFIWTFTVNEWPAEPPRQ